MDDNLMVERDETGRLLHQRKKVEDLEPDTAYVAKIKVRCFFKDYINIRVIFSDPLMVVMLLKEGNMF